MDAEAILERTRYGTHALHAAIGPMWDELPEPPNERSLVVRGFANIVRQHATAQWVLVQSELDVSATTLMRPTFEAVLRAIWCLKGAEDKWIAGFLSPKPEAINSDAETRMGPNVPEMLEVIRQHHPADIYEPLLELKVKTWRAMHSYVHAGIRPVVQSFVVFPHKEAASLLMNANGMLLLATNVVRMAHRLNSPQLPTIQRQYADCLPQPR